MNVFPNSIRTLIYLTAGMTLLTSFAIGAPTIAEEAKKMADNASKTAHQLADDYATELIKKHGDGKVTDAHIDELIKEKKISADSEPAKLIPKYIAARNTIITGKLAEPGTKAFSDFMEKLVGASVKNTAAAPAAPKIFPVDPFDVPSTRYGNAQTVAKLKSKLIAKQRLGTALDEVEAKEAAQETPFVASFSTHAIVGMRLLSPYTIQTVTENGQTTKTLKSDEAKAKPYLEFLYSNRLAWRDERLASAKKKWQDDDPASRTDMRSVWIGKGTFHLDGEIRAGYTFGSGGETPVASSTPNAISTERVVGESQFNADVLVAIPINFGEYPGGAYSHNIEFGGGTVTDAAEFDSNTHWFAGIGHTAQISGFLGMGDLLRRPTLVSARFGWGAWEMPQFSNGTSRSLKLRNGDVIDLDWDGCAALEVDLFFPVRESSYLNVGGRVYGSDPNVWTLYLGLTTDLKDLVEAFGR